MKVTIDKEDKRLNRIVDLLEIIAYAVTGYSKDVEDLMTKYHEERES